MGLANKILGGRKMTDLQSLKFIEKEKYEKGFSEIFENEIKKSLHPLEQTRLEKIKLIKKNKPYYYISNFIIVLLYVAILMVTADSSSDSDVAFFVLAGGLGVSYTYFVGRHKKAYSDSVKTTVLPKIAKFFGDFKYKVDGTIEMSKLKPSKIMPSHSSYKSEDSFVGKYKDVGINFIESLLTVRSNKSERTVFKGVFVLLEMKKSFKGQTVVKLDKGRMFNYFGGPSGMENVKLEDPEFEKKFEVYSTDQVEARYLLTTAFMDRLLRLTKAFNSRGVQCSFYDNHLLLTIQSANNLFEPKDINFSILNTDDIHKFLGQMQSVFQIVDILKLNLKIGL